MSSRLDELFEDKTLIAKIKERLPKLFRMAELECSRAGKIGMQVGSMREAIINALLIYKFGEENVDTEIPITEPEVDVKLFGNPISVKTITGANLGGVKLSWTVDARTAREFLRIYAPSCDILLAQIVWNGIGGLYYIPLETQQRVLREIGRESYIQLPKEGTNPRGVEFKKEAMIYLLSGQDTKSISIRWEKPVLDYNAYQRWVDYWRE